MRGRRAVIRQVARKRDEWKFLIEWISAQDQIVLAQDREKLDFVLDDDFVRSVLKKCTLRFFLTRDHQLLTKRRSRLDRQFSALQAFDLYGGAALEDALEYGSANVAYSGQSSPPDPQPIHSSLGREPPRYGGVVASTLVPPDKIDGLSLIEAHNGLDIQVKSGSLQTFMQLLQWLPYGYDLGFYDQYQNNTGTEDDPGVFVSIVRRDSTFIYKTGNHGWSSGWTYQSPEVLAAWMELNLRPAGARPSPLKTIDVRPMPTPPRDGW